MADFGLAGSLGTWDSADPVAALREIVEELPPVFTTLWVSDHLQQNGEAWPEAWSRVAYFAGALPRFRFGTLVLSQSYRNPALLAAMAATLQKASNGRLILGLGAGWLEEEYRAFHFDYPSGGVRVAQLAEAIEIIRAMWTGEPATYHGQWYGVDGAVCDSPDPPIPILVGTNGPKALQVVARLADWWSWDGPWETSYREPYERLAAACAEIGRPLGELTLAASLAISMPEDPAGFEASYTHDFYPGQVFANVGPTAIEVIREIELLVDHGVSHIQLDFANRTELGRFVTEVVPHVRLEPRSSALA
jgi:alkanesulfonate monooxygenase SsuD/methylene tetrahydromethanopterin reductase-like flavin-dependent oxidoreductase (luciferase family)